MWANAVFSADEIPYQTPSNSGSDSKSISDSESISESQIAESVTIVMDAPYLSIEGCKTRVSTFPALRSARGSERNVLDPSKLESCLARGRHISSKQYFGRDTLKATHWNVIDPVTTHPKDLMIQYLDELDSTTTRQVVIASGEAKFAMIARTLLERGIKVEFYVWTRSCAKELKAIPGVDIYYLDSFELFVPASGASGPVESKPQIPFRWRRPGTKNVLFNDDLSKKDFIEREASRRLNWRRQESTTTTNSDIKIEPVAKSSHDVVVRSGSNLAFCPDGKRCVKGIAHACPFLHKPEDIQYFLHHGGVGNMKFKSAPCAFVSMGKTCPRGNDCDYFHNECEAWCMKCKKSGHCVATCTS